MSQVDIQLTGSFYFHVSIDWGCSSFSLPKRIAYAVMYILLPSEKITSTLARA